MIKVNVVSPFEEILLDEINQILLVLLF